MSASLESHRDRLTPQEWRRLMKKSALYAQLFRARAGSGRDVIAQTGEEIVGITLKRVQERHVGYTFKDGDILFFYYLCRCCRRTVRTLYQHGQSGRPQAYQPAEDDEDTSAVLTEQVAVAFLQRRQSLDQFLSFIKEQKLRGKLRAYGAGFPRYGAENCNVERIAKDLRVTSATVAKYRSRLRELLEEFELLRARRNPA
jgi:hypothetical protein